MKRSTGLRDFLLVTGSLKEALDGKVINYYSGAVPASADDSIGAAVLLCTISVNSTGTGLTLEATAVNGQVTKNSSEIWSGEVIASGEASFFRMCTAADDNSASTTAVRMQGTIGLSGTDIQLGSTTLTVGNSRELKYFVVSIPAG